MAGHDLDDNQFVKAGDIGEKHLELKESNGCPVSESEHPQIIKMDTKVSWFVCGCFTLSNLIILGSLYTYAILFPKILEEFQESKAKTAMVASLGMALYTLLCPLSGALCVRFGCRVTMVTSGLMSALGLLGSSFAPSLDVLSLTFGVMIGSASSLVYMSAFEIIALYFKKYRDFATAMASMGPWAGVLVMSPIMQALLDYFDWRKTLLVFAGINLLPSILACSITRKSIPVVNNEGDTPAESSKPFNCGCCCKILHLLDFSMLKVPKCLILIVAGSVALLGVAIPFVHLGKHALQIGVSDHLSSWVVFAVGPASMFARILSGRLCNTDWISYLRFYQFGLILLAVVNCLAPMATTFIYLMVYSAAYGFCEGLQAVPIVCLIFNRYGDSGIRWFFFFLGIIAFLSPILAGWISDISGSYNPAFYTSGGILLLACCLTQLSRCIKDKNKEELKIVKEKVISEKETVI